MNKRICVLLFICTSIILSGAGNARASAGGAGGASGAGGTGGAGGANAAGGTAASFADVKRSDWAYGDIRKLAEASIVSGDKPKRREGGNGKGAEYRVIDEKPSFRPGDTLSREEGAVIVARLRGALLRGQGALAGPAQPEPADFSQQSYADVQRSRWSFGYIEAMKNYIPGAESKGARLFYPEDPMKRGDLIAALMRLTGAEARPADISALGRFSDAGEIGDEWKPYAAAAAGKAVLLGDDKNALNLHKPVTRREACALIVRALKGDIDFPEPKSVKLYVPETGSGFYDAYFDGAVFVGDSITMGLRNYVLNERARGNSLLGTAKFLCAGSYGLQQAAGKFDPAGVNLSYQGEDLPLEDCLSRMGAKEVYIMLGMNDWAGATLPGSIIMYAAVLDKIYAKNPDAAVQIQFCTPITAEREAAKLNNANMDKFNAAIAGLCAERGIDYVDVSAPMKNDKNALKAEYASDSYVHMSAKGCGAWINALREFAKGKYSAGLWGPPAGAGPAESYAGIYIEMD